MRTLVIICLVLCFSLKAVSQVQSNPYIQPDFAAAYNLDVKHMTVEWLYQSHSPDTAFIDIPASPQLPIMQALAAVFNTGNTLQADSPFSSYCIHTDTAVLLMHYALGFTIDTNFAWTHNWRNYQVMTGITALDQVLSHYGFYVYRLYPVWNSPQQDIILRTTQFLNLFKLADSLKSVPGILAVGPYSYGTVGSYTALYYEKNISGNSQFDIVQDGGFAPAHVWTYTVSPTWAVDSVSIYANGQYFTPLPNCGLHPLSINTPIKPPAFSISPNPATNAISFHAYDFAANYRIIDLQGRIVSHGKVIAPVNIVDISSLPSSTYSLQLITTKGSSASKLFTKQ